jgi:hypothetical protein
MKLAQGGLFALLQNNVVELRFKRRREKPGWAAYRRMLCTNDVQILSSVPGRIALHFKTPHFPPPYPWRIKNLVCTWDLFWQDWRMVSLETCDIITVIPTKPPDKFWGYFNLYLQSMSPSDKVAFMNK